MDRQRGGGNLYIVACFRKAIHIIFDFILPELGMRVWYSVRTLDRWERMGIKERNIVYFLFE